MAQQFGAVTRGRPASLVPGVMHNGDDVDEAAAFYRVMHQMRVEAEPQMHQWLAEIFRHGVGRD